MLPTDFEKTIKWANREVIKYALGILIFSIVSCTCYASQNNGLKAFENGDYVTAYTQLLPYAKQGDSKIQNVVGFMRFYGKGVERDIAEGLRFFQLAANQGNVVSQRNLGIIYALGAGGVVVDHSEALRWFLQSGSLAGFVDEVSEEDIVSSSGDLETADVTIDMDACTDDVGRETFLTFCAGCHGFNGVAFYPGAPSFSMGDQLVKNNETLMQSILNGKGLMPSWENKLPREQLEKALQHLRYLSTRSILGILPPVQDSSSIDSFFVFKPLGTQDENLWCLQGED